MKLRKQNTHHRPERCGECLQPVAVEPFRLDNARRQALVLPNQLQRRDTGPTPTSARAAGSTWTPWRSFIRLTLLRVTDRERSMLIFPWNCLAIDHSSELFCVLPAETG
jgi:hypothetical protein